MITYSDHARERMEHLAISEAMVRDVIANHDSFTFGRSMTIKFYGDREGRRIRVTLDPFLDLVLTVSYTGTIGESL